MPGEQGDQDVRHKFAQHDRDPHVDHHNLHLSGGQTDGPISWFNPTQANFSINSDDRHAPNIEYQWSSRNNRKDRHPLVVPQHDGSSDPGQQQYATPPPTTTAKAILHRLASMFTYFPVWDVTYLGALVFTAGSAIWVLTAFLIFLPELRPETEFAGEVVWGGGISGFTGCLMFFTGSLLLLSEVFNQSEAGNFGHACEGLLDNMADRLAMDGRSEEPGYGYRGSDRGLSSTQVRNYGPRHQPSARELEQQEAEQAARQEPEATAPSTGREHPPSKPWKWLPSLADIRTHYIHDLGFWACAVQVCGSSFFFASGIASLPPIYYLLTQLGGPTALLVAKAVPQHVGCALFVVASSVFMLETQERWWKPAPGQLGWWIGLGNLAGSVGFLLGTVFGNDFGEARWAMFASRCSMFCAAWLFLLSSLVQLYESLDKHPVWEKETKEKTEE